MTDIIGVHYEFICPHCNGNIIVMESEIACGIFRHGIYKNTGLQIPAHAPKLDCDTLSAENKIYGCGKPFRTYLQNNKIMAEVCDYI